jgi:SAM-dependent methyltransferase
MSEPRAHSAEVATARFPGWCCSYCAEPLRPASHGLYCAAEGRYFATDRGIHRLLPEERHRELRAFLELYQRVRRDEGWCATPGLPSVAAGHPHARIWRQRAASLAAGLALLEPLLPEAPWRVLDVGAGNCWIAAALLRRGHRVAAVDVDLDPEDGLQAAPALLPEAASLERAEAEMDALPLAPGLFDLVLATGSLHYPPRLLRTLIELRRVTRRGGVLLALDSPVYRRRPDGEAMVTRRMDEQARRYGLTVPRETQSGYLVLGELAELFRSAGWRLEIRGWPDPLRERARDLIELLRWRRRTARFPVLLARRDG